MHSKVEKKIMWDEKNLEILVTRLLVGFPYRIPKRSLKALKSAKYTPLSQDRQVWKTYSQGLRAYIILFDKMLTGCRHSAGYLLPEDPDKAHRIYLKCLARHRASLRDLVNPRAHTPKSNKHGTSYSPLDIKTEWGSPTPSDYIPTIGNVPGFVHLSEEVRPPAPVRRIPVEEYLAEKAKGLNKTRR